jgi:hypothetical protein
MTEDAPDHVVLRLTRAEALVLYEFLAREADRDSRELRIEDQAEERVLWDLEAGLESSLSEPLRADYLDLLDAARKAVRDED